MDLNNLNGAQQQRLQQAMLDAFTPAELDMLLQLPPLEKRPLHALVAPGDFEQQLFALVRRSQRESWTDRLVQAVELKRADHPKVKTLQADLSLIDGQRTDHVAPADPAQTQIVDRLGVARRAHDLLNTIDLPLSAFRRHYAATLDDMAIQGARNAADLEAMVLDLGGLQDGTPDRMSFGLLQFVVRVSRDPYAGPAAAQWLHANLPQDQRHNLATIEETLAGEQASKVVVFDVDNDQRGRPSRLAWFVGAQTQNWPSSAQPVPLDIESWEDLCARVVDVLDGLEGQGREIAEIHFVVEPALFDRPFHGIPRDRALQPGPEPRRLGELYVVLLRHCTRTGSAGSFARKQAERRAAALRRTPPKKIKRIPIPADGGNLADLFDRGDGFCYAAFVYGYPTEGRANEREVMRRLVTMMGVPYLCWLQHAPAGDWAKEFKRRLGRWLAACDGLGDFPSALLARRAGREDLAVHAALLWDDPSFVSLMPKTSPNRE